MVPMIVRVFVEDEVSEVPITPETTCRDVIECVRDPGEESCALLQTWGQGCERVLKDCDKPLEILQQWGPRRDPCKLVLKYTVLPVSTVNGEGTDTRNGMKEPGLFGDSLPEGVELTLSELEEMACRQQAQIDSQRQLLAAKEQRLRFLKQHEARHQQVAAEHERLRRLRDRVDAQELKLRKLRALRGQVHQNKLNNASLTSDLDSIRALFNEKEKELSVAVAKVEELTSQLEELRRGKTGAGGNTREAMTVQPSVAAQELDKLRRELMYRNKLNEQQNVRLSQQREALSQRQEEVASIDKRIAELQDRLHRKRILNQQLASQINAAAANNHQQHLRNALSASTIQQQHPLYQQSHGSVGNGTRGNIAAVEPYHHVPCTPAGKPPDHMPSRHPMYQPRNDMKPDQNRRLQNPVGQAQDSPQDQIQDDFNMKLMAVRKNSLSSNINNQNFQDDSSKKVCKDEKSESSELLPEFGASKSDPKYQTLPYNTKFTVNYVTQAPPQSVHKQQSLGGQLMRRPSGEGGENLGEQVVEYVKSVSQLQQLQQQLMNVVHSIPVPPGVNRGLATALANQNSNKSPSIPSSLSSNSPSPSFSSTPSNLAPRVYGTATSSLLSRGQPVGGASSTTSSTSSLATNSSASSSNSHQKPVSSVAPTSVQQSTYHQNQGQPKVHQISSQELPSQIYQTSSTKIQPVQPQTLSSTPQGILRDQKGELQCFQDSSSSSAPESPGTPKPALPPKPAVPVKPTPPPPPRQTVHWSTDPISDRTSNDDSQESKRFVRPAVDISADAVDTALNVLRGAVAISTRGGLSSSHDYQTKVNLSYQLPESAVSAAAALVAAAESSIPPPPPTTEPPIDETLTRRTDPPHAIKSRQLSIIKQPYNDLAKLRNGGVGVTSHQENGLDASDLSNNNSSSSSKNNSNSVNNNRCAPNESSSPCSSGSESNDANAANGSVQFSTSRRIEMPPAFLFPENEAPPADLLPAVEGNEHSNFTSAPNAMTTNCDEYTNSENNRLSSERMEDDNVIDTKNNINNNNNNNNIKEQHSGETVGIVRRIKKGNLKAVTNVGGKQMISRRVSFDPLALLLDASLEGELELVIRTAGQVRDPSAANDEGITALHNAICAGHLDIVRFLVQFGCDVNAQDSDGWTPLHCAASCNNLPMVRFLVEHGACIFATTLSDHETAAEKCEEDEEGFDGCSEYLYSVQEKLGILNSGAVYAVFSYEAHNSDELSFNEGERLVVIRKGDEWEREWWWARLEDKEGYIPRNLLGLCPRVHANKSPEQ